MYTYPVQYQNEVIDTVTIGNDSYFKVFSDQNNQTYFYRVDSLQKLYQYNFTLSADELIADFQMDVGDSVLIYTYDDSIDTIDYYLFCTGVNEMLVLVTSTTADTFYNCYSFYFDSPQMSDEETATWYSQNFGLIYSLMEYPPSDQTLIGAHIGGEDVLEIASNENIPSGFDLFDIYPNPFNNTAIIKMNVKINQFITIKMYDLLGKEVFTIGSDYYKAGKYHLQIDSKNLSSGVYIVNVIAQDYSKSKKVILLK